MLDTHVYEIVGEVLFRRTGNEHYTVLRCKVVRTRAVAAITNLGTAAMISLIGRGYEVCHFDSWFTDWSDVDNLYGDNLQSGRPIDVAVPIDVLESMIHTGRSSGAHTIKLGKGQRPFTSPVVAVLVDGLWKEPIPHR